MWIDLTHVVADGTPVYPGDPPAALQPALTLEKDGCRVHRLTLGTHTATHMDAPAHVLPGGAALADFPLSDFMGPACVLDCRGVTGEIGPGAVDRLCSGEGLRWLLFLTGAAALWGGGEYFTQPWPVPSPALLEAAAARGVRGLGWDSPGPDRPGELWRHRLWLERSGGLIVENLVNLEAVLEAGRTCEFWALPLRLAASDGAPVRAAARV